MDVVYYVRNGDYNEELRYSLRSLSNIPHRKVFFVGYKPKWAKNVNHIDVPQVARKTENTERYMDIISSTDEISEDFILMHDDFFIMQPLEEVPRLNRGPIDAVLECYRPTQSVYYYGMKQTLEYMKELGLRDIISYELHVPMVLNKTNIRKMLERYWRDKPNVVQLNKRTLYGNLFNYGGESIQDVKVSSPECAYSKNSIFLSTDDGTFRRHEVGKYIRERFGEKSAYEY